MAAMFLTRSSARSQMAYNSALRALRQASKWAACEIGPAPTTPILSNRASFSIIFFLLFSIFGGWSSSVHRHQEQRRCSDNACLNSQVRIVKRHIAVGGHGSRSNDAMHMRFEPCHRLSHSSTKRDTLRGEEMQQVHQAHPSKLSLTTE